jgi:hypothetical protein
VIADYKLARELAARGLEMNLEIDAGFRRLLKEFPGSNRFNAAIAHAFTWTGHAVDEDGYHEAATGFLDSGGRESLDGAKTFSRRFGPDALSDALQGWRAIVEEDGGVPDLGKDAASLKRLQDRMLPVAARLREEGAISGIGAWLFCAPFKIVAISCREFWDDPDLDEVLMPLGLEVVRGMKKLVRARSAWTEGIDRNMLVEEEGDLGEGMGTVWLVQDTCKKIAAVSQSRVVHINSGIYLLGKGDLEAS